MAEILFSALGAALPVVVGLMVVSRRFGGLEGKVSGLDRRLEMVESQVSGFGEDVRTLTKEQHEGFNALLNMVHENQVGDN
ncbi:MAG: hypothetical protein ACR2LG_05855 [Actinomycetota bacterium]